MEGLGTGECEQEQQFCLRWNNFQANITSQFEALRDDEDFVDVTLACEGHRLEAHKVVLSACSPYFKELFKNNPCPHPIIFMRDCELVHIAALLEFMYAGEVNISQAQLSSFLKTAEALQIRGLTDSSDKNESKTPMVKHQSSQLRNLLCGRQQTSPAKDTCQNVNETKDTYQKTVKHYSQSRKAARNVNDTSGAAQSYNGISDRNVFLATTVATNSKSDFKDTVRLSDSGQNDNYYKLSEGHQSGLNESEIMDSGNINPFALGNVNSMHGDFHAEMLEPKLEMPDYASDEEIKQEKQYSSESVFSADVSQLAHSLLNFQGDIAGTSQEVKSESDVVERRESGGSVGGGRVCCAECGRRYSNLSNLRQHVRLIHRSQPVACPLCSRSFKTQLYLRRHTLSQHSNVQHNDKTIGNNNVRNINIVRAVSLSNRDNNRNQVNMQSDIRSQDQAILTPIIGIPQMIKIHTLPALNSIIKRSIPKCVSTESRPVNGNEHNFDTLNGDVDVSSPDSVDEDMIELVEDDMTDET